MAGFGVLRAGFRRRGWVRVMSSRKSASSKNSRPSRLRLTLVLDSTVSSADLASDVLTQFARGAGYSDEQQEAISLAVRECAANAIVHGNCGDLHKKVFVEAAV